MPAGLDGAVEHDKSYFGPRRVRGKRDQEARGKATGFGLFNRGGQVDTEIVPDCSKKTFRAIIRGKIDVAAMGNAAGWRGSDGLVDVGVDRHFCVRHSRDEFIPGASPSNGIASF